MKIDVILDGTGGELARDRVDVAKGETHDERVDFDERVDDAVSAVIEGWVLSVGDTIRIVAVEDEEAERPNYVYVDVEDRDCLVRVYDDRGELEQVEFVSDRELVDGAYETRVAVQPYEAAVAFAQAEAAKLGCEWGDNLPQGGGR